jgi:hypothetical protein
MDEKVQDLESRVKRLENLHIWGLGLVLVGIVVLFMMDKKKSSSFGSAEVGGAINPPPPPPSI